MRQLILGILKNPESKIKITLVWSVNSDPDIFLLDQFRELQRLRPDQLDVHYLVTNPIKARRMCKATSPRTFSQEPKSRRRRASARFSCLDRRGWSPRSLEPRISAAFCRRLDSLPTRFISSNWIRRTPYCLHRYSVLTLLRDGTASSGLIQPPKLLDHVA